MTKTGIALGVGVVVVVAAAGALYYQGVIYDREFKKVQEEVAALNSEELPFGANLVETERGFLSRGFTLEFFDKGEDKTLIARMNAKTSFGLEAKTVAHTDPLAGLPGRLASTHNKPFHDELTCTTTLLGQSTCQYTMDPLVVGLPNAQDQSTFEMDGVKCSELTAQGANCHIPEIRIHDVQENLTLKSLAMNVTVLDESLAKAQGTFTVDEVHLKSPTANLLWNKLVLKVATDDDGALKDGTPLVKANYQFNTGAFSMAPQLSIAHIDTTVALRKVPRQDALKDIDRAGIIVANAFKEGLSMDVKGNFASEAGQRSTFTFTLHAPTAEHPNEIGEATIDYDKRSVVGLASDMVYQEMRREKDGKVLSQDENRIAKRWPIPASILLLLGGLTMGQH